MAVLRNGLLGVMMLASAPVLAQGQADPSGVWMRDDGNARVRIAPCGSDICATNLWIGDTSKGEEVGDVLVMKLKPKSANELSGNAYDPKRDRNYAMTLRVAGDSLVTRGCVLGGIICRDVNWTPAGD
jgi:uncharacterized protein (DUF2147 family)